MKQTFIHRKVIKVYGYQIHAVEAESYIDAVRLAKIGKAGLDDENLEVVELSDICEVSLPDDRNATTIDMRNVEIAESNPKDHLGGVAASGASACWAGVKQRDEKLHTRAKEKHE